MHQVWHAILGQYIACESGVYNKGFGGINSLCMACVDVLDSFVRHSQSSTAECRKTQDEYKTLSYKQNKNKNYHTN